MRNKLLLSCLIVALGVISCEDNKHGETHHDRERDRVGALGIQSTEVEETSNSSETTDPGRTDPKYDTIPFKEMSEKE